MATPRKKNPATKGQKVGSKDLASGRLKGKAHDAAPIEATDLLPPVKAPGVRQKPDHDHPFRFAVTGAPTTFEECFCERVVICGSHGLTLAQMAWDLGASRTTLMDWAETHPAFSESLLRARDASLAWWETQGQKGLWAGKDFNDRVLKFLMTNQHKADYKERVEVSGALAKIDFGRMTDEQLAAISAGQHPYEVLAPKREVLVGVPVEEAEVVGTPQPPGGESPDG